MPTNDMNDDVCRLLEHERQRIVLSHEKQCQLHHRLRRAALAAIPDGWSTLSGSAPWRLLALRPFVALAVLLFLMGAAAAWIRVGPSLLAPRAADPAPATVAQIKNQGLAALRAELALISQAKRAIAAGQTSEAQRLLSSHAQRFPTGALAEERQGLDVMLLWHLGQKRQAAQAASRFEKHHPHSPMNRPIRRLLFGQP